jgi:hypothetical protein
MAPMDPTEEPTGAVLASGLDHSDARAAEMAGFLQHPLTLIDRLSTPFLHQYSVYRVMPRHLSHPILRHVAGGKGLPTLILEGESSALVDLLRQDGSMLDSPGDAVAYIEVLLEVVTPRPGLTRVVSAFDEIPFREDLGDEDRRAKASAEASLSSRVEPPEARPRGEDWDVSLWVARDGALRLETVTLDRRGHLLDEAVSETYDLPLITVA